MDRAEYIDIESDGGNTEVLHRVRLLGYAKNVKFYAILEAMFDFYIGIFIFWPFMFLGGLSLCGFYGAKKFNNKLVYAYYVGDIIKLLFKLLIALYSPYVFTLIVSWLMCIISVIYIITIKRFYDELTNSPLEDITQLRAGWQPRIVHFVF